MDRRPDRDPVSAAAPSSGARYFSESDGALRLFLRVTPNASKDAISGLWRGPAGEQRLAVRVAAPPDKGRANKAVLKLLAKALALPKSAVSLTGGEKDRLKTVAVEGAPGAAVARLEAIVGGRESGENK